MMILSAFLRFAESKPISQVLCGTWTGGSIFSTSEDFKFENKSFVIEQSTGPNWLKTKFNDDEVFINLSYTDLSGNISFNEEIFFFNFKQTSPPLISANIEFGDIIAHVSFASHTCVKVVLINSKGDSDTIVFTKEPEKAINSVKNSLPRALPVVAMAVIFAAFQWGVKRAQAKMAFEQKEEKKEEEKQEEAKAKDEKKEEETKNEEAKAEEEEEEKEKAVELKEKEKKDDDGIVKRKAKKTDE